MAAAILVRLREICKMWREERSEEDPPRGGFAPDLIPALQEEYLRRCGIAEFAPPAAPGLTAPCTKIMALFRAIYATYVDHVRTRNADLDERKKRRGS